MTDGLVFDSHKLEANILCISEHFKKFRKGRLCYHMENTFLGLGSLAINGSLAVAVIYFGKKWMDKVEQTAADNRLELKESHETNSTELKEAIKLNRDEYREKANEINESIKVLAERVGIANGRTTKNELAHVELVGDVKAMMKLCAERHNHIGDIN